MAEKKHCIHCGEPTSLAGTIFSLNVILGLLFIVSAIAVSTWSASIQESDWKKAQIAAERWRITMGEKQWVSRGPVEAWTFSERWTFVDDATGVEMQIGGHPVVIEKMESAGTDAKK